MFTTFSLPDGAVPRVLRSHAVLITLVLVHLGAALAVSHAVGKPLHSGFIWALWFLFVVEAPVYLLVIFLRRLLHMVTVVRPARPLVWIIRDIHHAATDPDRMLGGVTAIFCIAVFQQSFSFLKAAIPLLLPFSWDADFAAADRWFHFGHDPYLLLLPLIQFPAVTLVLNMVYHLWFVVMIFFMFAASFTRVNLPARDAFLIGMILTWAIGGNFLATLFSSAGPVYYARLGLGDTFVPLTEMLRQQSLTVWLPALDVQEMLWQGYLGHQGLEGISAMPSMHVGSSVLMTCYAFTWRRWAGWGMVVFCTLILIGSVALGWHYAIDGYAGALVAFFCWHLAQRMAGSDAGLVGARHRPS